MKRMGGFMVATVMFLVLLISGCGGGGGGDSSPAAPSAPTGVTAAAGHGEATISWTGVAGATSYNIYYSTTSGVTKATGIKVPDVISPRIITPLTNGTTYYFVVTAVNANGESIESSQVSAMPTPNPPPPSPTGVSAAAGSGQATISWLPVTDATSYNIYYSITPGVTKATGTKVPNVTSPRIVTPLTNGTTYYFVVTAVNANGESGESSQVSALPTPNPPPTAPTGVQAAAASGQSTISWQAVVGATSYNIYYSSTAGVTKLTGTKIPNVTSPKVVTPLTNGTIWYFVVTAQNADGESVESSQVSSFFNNPPVAPTGVGAVAGPGQVTVSWSAVAAATSYNLYYSTTAGVTKATGTKVAGVTSPKVVTAVRGTPYFFVVTAQNADGESVESNEANATPDPPDPNFSQSDLAGTWNIRVILSGANPGWYSVKASVNSVGVVSILGTGGPATPHVIPALSMTSGTGASAGVVTETGAGSEPTFHGKMSSSKNLIAGVSTSPGDPNTFAMHIFIRQIPGVIYSNADLENTTFDYNRTYSGGSHYWEKAQGSTNAFRQISITSKADSAGPASLPPANYTTISMDSGGTVGIGAEPTFSGVMSPDKKIIVGTSTDAPGTYSLRIIRMRGQIYTQADLAGTHKAYAFHSDSVSSWGSATWSTDLTGNVTFVDYLGSNGDTTLPDPFTLYLDAQGNITSLETTQHGGMLSFGKDLMVDLGDYLDGSYFVIKVQ